MSRRYIAETPDGKEVMGNYVVYEGLNLIMVRKEEGTITRTLVLPSTLKEVELSENEK